jgi:hypothetical protein
METTQFQCEAGMSEYPVCEDVDGSF